MTDRGEKRLSDEDKITDLVFYAMSKGFDTSKQNHEASIQATETAKSILDLCEGDSARSELVSAVEKYLAEVKDDNCYCYGLHHCHKCKADNLKAALEKVNERRKG